MTVKLYYQDAYIREFTATVLLTESLPEGFRVLLDRTAFFPEEGGQSADNGWIADARVTDVREEGGEIYHYVDSPLTEGDTVSCCIDFYDRYEKMKSHTAEHILCGVFHSLWGLDNVGFHLGAESVVFDVNAPLSAEQIERAELEANRIVAENVSVTAWFPTVLQLAGLEYRAKLELTENVRIVDIGEYDSCACCAPHVARTGEIGIIKILDFEKHRGGTRITMVAGENALNDYRARCTASQRISALTCTPQSDIVSAVEALQAECEQLRYALKVKGLAMAAVLAQSVQPTDGNAVVYCPELNMDELRELARLASPAVGGIFVALSGTVGDCKYVIASSSVDLRAKAKEINAALGGRGGGRPEMIQGSFAADPETVKKYFA